MQNGLQERLDKQWTTTCRLLLGKEIGELAIYKDWLCEGLEPFETRKSALSGKEVVAVGKYPRGTPFISFDEISHSRKFEPLSINEIKDIDSIVQAVSEKAVYTGNIVLGNSSHVEKSSGVENSHFIFASHTLHNSQDIAHTTLAREDKAIFGSVMVGESEFCIRMFNALRAQRCLEGWRIIESSDVHYSHSLEGCTECMFCFNLKGKRYCTGNAELPKDKYFELKKKLLAELADELQAKKRLRSLPELLFAIAPKTRNPRINDIARENDIERINEGFRKTIGIVLGKTMAIEPLEKYLTRNIRAITRSKSTLSKLDVYGDELAMVRQMAQSKRQVKLAELEAVSTMREWPKEFKVEGLNISNIGRFIEPVAYMSPEEEGQNKNTIECSSVYEASDCFRCSRVYEGKYCAYSFWPRNSEHMYGCDSTRNSSFCLNCYNSYKLSRCFEVDTSQNCTGSYFLHNCENVHDSMFCFNVKNLRYAIGNAEVDKAAFEKFKSMLLAEVLASLEKTHDYKRSIYLIGARK